MFEGYDTNGANPSPNTEAQGQPAEYNAKAVALGEPADQP